MRDFSTLDPISLRAFRFAAHFGNFTAAAKKAGLTQSGISQHIQKLEAELGVLLFFRNGRTVAITPEGKKLVQFIEAYADQVDQLRHDFDHQVRQLRGLVAYGMPNSCLMTPHFQMLLTKREAFPEIDLRVVITHSEDVTQKLLDGSIDFGFVTIKRKHPVLTYEAFAREEYVLAGAPSAKGLPRQPKDIKASSFVKYPGMDILFSSWLSAHFSRSNLSAEELRYTGEINDLAGAITMVKNGLGLSVFPKHCVQNELDRGALRSFPENREACSATFPIWIVKRNDVTQSARVRAVMTAFWEMVK